MRRELGKEEEEEKQKEERVGGRRGKEDFLPCSCLLPVMVKSPALKNMRPS